MTEKQQQPACPYCGDTRPFRFWTDPEMPKHCPFDKSRQAGGPPSVFNVTECPQQMGKARQTADMMKLVPDAFDQMGKLKPEELHRVLEAFHKAYPNRPFIA